MKAITDQLVDGLEINEEFTMNDAYNIVEATKKEHSIRARIYEGVQKGIFKKISRGVYSLIQKDNNHVLMIEGNGRDLSMLEDNSIDCIITDHPYLDKKSNKGGNRNFAEYSSFKYTQEDFNEKARVLKEGAYLVEFFAEENSNNYEYIYQCKQYAKSAGLNYYTSVNWKKGKFVANTGRKAKNTEQLAFFTKGESRSLKVDVKKNLKVARDNNLLGKDKKIPSHELTRLLEDNKLEVNYMKGTSKMLPTEFDFEKIAKSKQVHQAEKPVELFENLLDYITKENELVLDQFSGSGNLGVACLKKKRNAILIEKDSDIYSISNKSIKQKIS